MSKKRKSKFNSLSTPGNKQDLSNYLVELIFLRNNRGIRLKPKFWQLTKYKGRYRREIMACRKFIKKYGESYILSIALNNYITTWTNFAHIEFLLQQLQESELRKKSLKDLTSPNTDFTKETKDLRDYVVEKTAPKGLFDRLRELSGEKEES